MRGIGQGRWKNIAQAELCEVLVARLYERVVNRNNAMFIEEQPRKGKSRRVAGVFGVEPVGRAEQRDGGAVESAEAALGQADGLRRRLIVDFSGLQDEAVRHVRLTFDLPPQEQYAVFGEAMAANADSGDQKTAAGHRVGVVRGFIALVAFGVDLRRAQRRNRYRVRRNSGQFRLKKRCGRRGTRFPAS